jgi:hypothetical protein
MLTKNIATMIEETEAHVAADSIRQGHYWHDDVETGCFIGCLTHSSDETLVTELYGIPEQLVNLLEDQFENVPPNKAAKFFIDVVYAIGVDNKDLTEVYHLFGAHTEHALLEQYGPEFTPTESYQLNSQNAANGVYDHIYRGLYETDQNPRGASLRTVREAEAAGNAARAQERARQVVSLLDLLHNAPIGEPHAD